MPGSIGRLQAAQMRVLAPELAGVAGAHGLWLATDPRADLPATPLLQRWTRLHLADDLFAGDLRLRADEPLPFQDDVFCVVALSHALERVPCSASLLDEAVRVLAPEGLLVISGFHVLSAWSPWLLARRGPRPALVLPLRWRRQLARLGVHTCAVRRYGAALPMLDADRGSTWLGGGFVLLARKRRVQATPLRTQARRRPVAVGKFAPGARRERA